jgi:hypothetical protein
MFPIFFIILYPASWIIVLPVNFLIDLLVLYLSMKHLKIEDAKKKLFPAIFKVWIIGFLSDLIGCLLLLGIVMVNDIAPFLSQISTAMCWNPYQNIFAFLLILTAIAVSGAAVYFLNRRFSFRKLSLTALETKKISLYLAVFTAPYVLLIPTMLLYPIYL